MSKNQYHHYIPRFILKTFADNFALDTSNSGFVASSSQIFEANSLPKVLPGATNSNRGSNKKKKNGRAGTAQQPVYHIRIYRVKSCSIELADTARAYAIENMYRDVKEEDCMKFEKLLAKYECTAATFIRRIWGSEDLCLTRDQLSDLKEFLVMMAYRSEHRMEQYYYDRFDIMTRLSVQRHMKYNNIEKMRDVWFANLKWLIETPVQEIMKELLGTGPKDNNLFSFGYNGPVHYMELTEFVALMHMYVCVWEAEEGSEFILSNDCFGAFEGPMHAHKFFVVSPKYAIVLANRMFMSEVELETWFGKRLRPFPETVYKKPQRPGELDPSPNDVFRYKRIVASKRDVYLVNSIFLDAEGKCWTYKSSVSMYNTLRFYDKVKKELFITPRDFSPLKRKLFAELNRTHSS